MKLSIDLTEQNLTKKELDLILIWKQRKYKDNAPTLTFGQCLELLIAVTYNFHQDFSDGRFFNHILIGHEFVFAYDGDEPIETLFYEIRSQLHKRYAVSPNLN